MDIARVLKEYKITPLRSKDQFFLADEAVLDYEVDLAGLMPEDVVLEIGAGIGNLTRKIAQHAIVIAIEKDKRFLPLLRKIENCDVIIGDALEVLEEKRKTERKETLHSEEHLKEIQSHLFRFSSLHFNKIISNIPFHLSQRLLVELLQHEWNLAVLCVQRAFAEKLWKKKAIGIAVNDCCDMDIVKIVPADAFYPRAVESAIIILQQRHLLNPDFWSFLKITYTKRNKDVKNVVKNAPLELVRKKVHQLSTEELKKLYEALKREKLKSPRSKDNAW